MEELIEVIKKEYLVDSIDEIDNWNLVSLRHSLSEEFIREFQDKVNWKLISGNQKLSESFIREFHDRIDWLFFIYNENTSNQMFHNLFDIHPFLKWVRDCGSKNRVIFRTKRKPNIIFIGCFKGSEEEAIEAINLKYGENTPEALEYIAKVRECFRD